MRIERDHRRDESRLAEGVEHRAMTPVHAVEAPDRHGPRGGLDLVGSGDDVHVSSLARASSGEMIRSGSASLTENGPISVRRSSMQWPPSASAIARM